MPNEMRIKNLAMTTSPDDSDVFPIDSTSYGTRGVTLTNLIAKIFNKVGFSIINSNSATYSGVMTATNFITTGGVNVNNLAAATNEGAGFGFGVSSTEDLITGKTAAISGF